MECWDWGIPSEGRGSQLVGGGGGGGGEMGGGRSGRRGGGRGGGGGGGEREGVSLHLLVLHFFVGPMRDQHWSLPCLAGG